MNFYGIAVLNTHILFRMFTRPTIDNTVKRYLETSSTRTLDRQQSGRPKLLSRDHYVATDNAMDDDNKLTTPRLKKLLLQTFSNLQASERTITRARQELGWVHQTAKYCQMVREANKCIRLEWAQKMISDNEQFDDVVFTDESTFQVEYHARKAYRRIGEPRILHQKPKHPAKVHVWTGISKKGATNSLYSCNLYQS